VSRRSRDFDKDEAPHPALCGCAACAAFLEGGPAAGGASVQATSPPAYLDAVVANENVYRWTLGSPLGTPVTLTYSFMASLPEYHSAAEWRSFRTLTSAQEVAAREVLALIAEVCGVTFVEVSDAGAGGQIRFGRADFPARAFAHYPERGTEQAGDVAISTRYAENLETDPGEFGFFVLLHEVGHALGLKHSFSPPALPDAEENHQFSMMSYTLHPHSLGYVVQGAGHETYDVEIRSPMLYDIGALQYLYGANMATRTGNDVYAWETEERFIETIWDAGGIDTIDFSNQLRNATIDLTPGSFSSLGPDPFTGVSATTRAELEATGAVYGIDNLAIAYGVTIENAIGGSGNDRLIGNTADNALAGGAGGDTLIGQDGADRLTGGPGHDWLEGGRGIDAAVYAGSRGGYLVLSDVGHATVIGAEGNDTLVGVERIEFSDAVVLIDALVEPAVTLTLEAGSIVEGTLGALGWLPFTLRLSSPAPGPVVVTYATVDGTASPDYEYDPVSLGSITIPSGATTAQVLIRTIGDVDPETDETVVLRLLSIDGPPEVAFGSPIEAAGTIEDDDFVEVSVADVTVNEGPANAWAQFVISLSDTRIDGTWVSWALEDGSARWGSDFGGNQSGAVFIAPGLTQAVVSAPILQDIVIEGTETFSLILRQATGGAGIVLGSRSVATATILDDDVGEVSLTGIAVAEGDAGSTVATVGIALSKPSATATVVTLSTAGGTAEAGVDYVAVNGLAVTIPAGQTAASLSVAILGDMVLEADETFTVGIDGISNPLIAVSAAAGVATVEIGNDDVGEVSLTGIAVAEGDAGNTVATVGITLSKPSATATVVTLSTAGGTAEAGVDYVAVSGLAVTIPAGQTAAGLSVTILGDTMPEVDETFTVRIDGISNPLIAVSPSAGVATVEIGNDDDGGAITIVGGTAEEGHVFAVEGSLPSPLAAATVIRFRTVAGSAEAGSDFVAVAEGAVSLAAGATGFSIPVSILDDAIGEDRETFTIEISGSDDPLLLIDGAHATATILIEDDDAASAVIHAVTVAEDAGTAEVPVVLSHAASADVLLSYRIHPGSARAGSDFAAVAEGVVTIPAGQTGATIVIVLADDGVYEADESFLVEIAAVDAPAWVALKSPGLAQVTIANDDPLAGEGGLAFDTEAVKIGTPGNDAIEGGVGKDVVYAAEGEDTALGNGGDDVMVGAEGGDLLIGGGGTDFLVGWGGGDGLFGGAGDDVILGDDGPDTIEAGPGNDRVHLTAAAVFADGGDGILDVLLPVGPGPWHIDLADPIDQNQAGAGPGLRGFEAVDLALAGGAGTVLGTEHDGLGAILFGGLFDDSLVGSTAADIILGQAGDDTLLGGDGDDSIVADQGNDSVALGAGADRIFVPGGDALGTVTVADFVPGEDRLLLPATLGEDAAAVLALLASTDAGARLDIAAGRSIVLVGLQPIDITAGDIELIT